MALTLPDLSGWLAALALLATAALPLLRRLRRSPSGGTWPPWYASHFWLGRLAAAAGVLHCLASVRTGSLPTPAEVGLWLASLAAALLVLEALVGSSLRRRARGRPARRRLHLWLLALIALTGGLHVLLDVLLPL